MSRVLVIAAWCFLQVESRHPEIITSNSNHGNFLDNDKWLSTVSQYDRDKYWNKFRDIVLSDFLFKLWQSENLNLNRTSSYLFLALAKSCEFATKYCQSIIAAQSCFPQTDDDDDDDDDDVASLGFIPHFAH
ncbi:testican-3-like protein [Willisornis vidua]|uniref:Testican-3-like protein n=1 Tax=Willisornis vidua TaxID=1566151 RepID=A0ABQ9DMB5_9PASS|nr:testican-3-like protein [Willisornis vidua]